MRAHEYRIHEDFGRPQNLRSGKLQNPVLYGFFVPAHLLPIREGLGDWKSIRRFRSARLAVPLGGVKVAFIFSRTPGSDNSTMSCRSCVPGIIILASLLLETGLFRLSCAAGAAPAHPGRHNTIVESRNRHFNFAEADLKRSISNLPKAKPGTKANNLIGFTTNEICSQIQDAGFVKSM